MDGGRTHDGDHDATHGVREVPRLRFDEGVALLDVLAPEILAP
jgi:hypothetical protein